MDKKVWSKQEIKKLIARYKENPILWNTRSVDYKNMVKKRLIQENLSTEFNTTVVELGRKMRTLRAQWLKEYKNMKKYDEDFGADYAYESKWIWFRPLMTIFGFEQSNDEDLVDNSGIIAGDKQRDNETDQNYDDTYLHIKEDHSCADDDDIYGTLRECDGDSTELNFKDEQCENKMDEYQIFGNYVANELRSMHYEKNVRELKRLIQKHIVRWTEEDDKEYYST